MIRYFPDHIKPHRVQIEALEMIHQALVVEDRRAFVLDAPTGSGKSAIGITVAKHFESAFLTSPLNFLVEQYERDYPALNAIQGKTNYICSNFPVLEETKKLNCAAAQDTDEGLHKEVCRDYISWRDSFWRGPLSVTNLDFLYWAPMPATLEGTGSDHRRILVVDECHNLEEKLCDFGRVQITRVQVGKLGMPVSKFDEVGNDSCTAQHLAETFIHYAEEALRQDPLLAPEERRVLKSKIAALQLTLEVGDWIHWRERDDATGREAIVLKPMRAHIPAARLFSKADKLLFMSATVGKVVQFLAGLGLSESEAAWHQADSEFPVENRFVQIVPGVYVSKANMHTALPKLVSGCKQVMEQCPNEKGLILCPSYTLQRQLAKHLGPRALTHNKDDKDEVLKLHCLSNDPTVLIGVWLHEGLDLKDDLARFLIIPKVLYPNLGDPYVKERTRRDERWYGRQTALAMVQGAGRVVRTPDDWAHIVILDSNFSTLLNKHRDMFPDWFLKAVQVPGRKPPMGESLPTQTPQIKLR